MMAALAALNLNLQLTYEDLLLQPYRSELLILSDNHTTLELSLLDGGGVLASTQMGAPHLRPLLMLNPLLYQQLRSTGVPIRYAHASRFTRRVRDVDALARLARQRAVPVHPLPSDLRTALDQAVEILRAMPMGQRVQMCELW